MQPDSHRQAISAMGRDLGPAVLAACHAVFDEEQSALAATVDPTSTNVAYADHPRQVLDIYGPEGGSLRPVIVFVHGGGFVMGDKGDNGSWANANVGRMAASEGMVGVVINYRLAPDHQWPAGSEDVGLALDWVREHIAAHGGDPACIFLMGTSAGAIHVAGLTKLRPDLQAQVKGLILLSGLYGYTPPEDKDLRYYGAECDYAGRAPAEALVECGIPLLLTCAQYDPPRFQREFVGLLSALAERNGVLPATYIASGHNHYTMSLHLGSDDKRLADEIAVFVTECC